MVLGALLAALLAVLTTADRFACPDGCTRATPAQVGSGSLSPACALCHGWSPARLVISSRPAWLLVAWRPAARANLSEPTLPEVDPPPRT